MAQAEAIKDYDSFYAEQITSGHKQLMPLLDSDGDGDGMCSRAEFMQANDRIFRAADANGDGQLSGAEMTRVEQPLGETAVNQRRASAMTLMH